MWVVAAVAVAAVVALALTVAGVDRIEIVATLMFVVVFSAALLGGRTTGFLIAAACTVAYLVLRSQDVDEVGAPAVGLLILTRGACYVAVAQVTQLVRNRLPDVDPSRLPTGWNADDAPVPTALYAGPVGHVSAERAAPAVPGHDPYGAHDPYDRDPHGPYDPHDPWGDPDATAAAPPPWAEDEPADFAAAAAADGWGPQHDPWGQPAVEPEPQLAPTMAAAAPGWDPPMAADEWGEPLPDEPYLAEAAADGGGWDRPTGVMSEVPEPSPPMGVAGPDRAPWEVDLDAPGQQGWAPSAYDRPPAPSMPTGWIDDATSPLGDETIPVGYTGELFIAREMARLPLEGRPGPNGGPHRVNGGPDHHVDDDVDHPPSNGRLHVGGDALPPTAPVPTLPAGPTGPPGSPGPGPGPGPGPAARGTPGGGFGAPGPPPSAAHPPAGGRGGGGFVPMSDPSEGIDPETRLWNARFFRERLAVAREAAVRDGAGFSVVMIQVPDQPFQPLPYRRQVALLRELGHQFVSAGYVDHLVHLPDDNLHWFAVVLGDSDRVGATTFERRLRSAISGYLRNRGLHIGEIQSLSLTSPDDDEAMAVVWSSLLGSPGGHEGPAMAYGGQA